MNTDARLVALEERLEFQQRQLDEVNGVVLGQRREIDRLSMELAQQRAAVERLRDAASGEDLTHEKPPHY